MRLIDADAFSEKICEECKRCYVAPHEIDRMIAKQPTVPAFGKWNKLPFDEFVLITDGKHVWKDCFCVVDNDVYLDSGAEIANVIAWMPLPEPPKESSANKEQK